MGQALQSGVSNAPPHARIDNPCYRGQGLLFAGLGCHGAPLTAARVPAFQVRMRVRMRAATCAKQKNPPRKGRAIYPWCHPRGIERSIPLVTRIRPSRKPFSQAISLPCNGGSRLEPTRPGRALWRTIPARPALHSSLGRSGAPAFQPATLGPTRHTHLRGASTIPRSLRIRDSVTTFPFSVFSFWFLSGSSCSYNINTLPRLSIGSSQARRQFYRRYHRLRSQLSWLRTAALSRAGLASFASRTVSSSVPVLPLSAVVCRHAWNPKVVTCVNSHSQVNRSYKDHCIPTPKDGSGHVRPPPRWVPMPASCVHRFYTTTLDSNRRVPINP